MLVENITKIYCRKNENKSYNITIRQCKTNTNYVGFEINPKYIEIAENRLAKEIGLFL